MKSPSLEATARSRTEIGQRQTSFGVQPASDPGQGDLPVPPGGAAVAAQRAADQLPRQARARWREIADNLRDRFRDIAELMDEAEHDVFASMVIDESLRSKLSSTNPLERVNMEIKRRTSVVGIVPNREAVIRLIGALMLEQNDERAVSRRCMPVEKLTAMCNDPNVATMIAAQ